MQTGAHTGAHHRIRLTFAVSSRRATRSIPRAIFVVSTIVAMIAALAQSAVSGKLTPLLRNTAVLAVSLAHPKELGISHVTRGDGSFRSVGRPVPYAVPVIVATVLVLAFGT